MRVLRSPQNGYLADHDMIGYWPGTSSATVWKNETTELGKLGNDRAWEAPDGSLPLTDTTQYPFYRRGQTGFFFTGGETIRSAAATPDDTGYCTNATVGFSFAAWYRFFGTSAATATLIERSVTPNGSSASGLLWELRWLNSEQRFVFRGATTASGVFNEVYSPTVSTVGWVGLEVEAARIVRFYHSDVKGGQLGSTATLASALPTNVATAASARWTIGGSIHRTTTGSYNSQPASNTRIDAVLADIALWRRPLGAARWRDVYANCVRPWDEAELLASNHYRTEVRVLLEDASGTMQDVTRLDGQNWLVSASRDKDVDDPLATADVVLRRRRGGTEDFAPLNTDSINDFANYVDLRRKVVIERAFVPYDWNLEGWEFSSVFEGYVDDYSVDVDTVRLACTDSGAVLNDVFILETRPYNYGVTGQSLETTQQQIIDDFAPGLIASSGVIQPVGYKGFTRNPRLYTEAGTVTTPTFVPSAFQLRYNDVSSGPVIAALQAAADQIGYATEFKYHEPWGASRLTTYSPRRSLGIAHDRVTRLGVTSAEIEFREPHGLSVGVPVTINGGLFQQTNTVASIRDFYRIITQVTTGSHVSNASLGSGGSVAFSYNLDVNPDQIIQIAPVKASINRIRNHAIVRFNRVQTTATFTCTQIDVLGGYLTVGVDRNIGNIDPENNGITFTLSGATLASEDLNGTYSGTTNGTRGVFSDVTTTAPDGTYTTDLPILSSQYINYREVVSTASASLTKYGYLPVAVFEGTNLAISTDAEAERLAAALISDLAQPTVDFSITLPVQPLELHDVVRLPASASKGRWSSAITAAVVGLSERYASGECLAEYRMRYQLPSRGTRWAERIVVTPDRPAPPNVFVPDMVDQASRWRLAEATKLARRFNFNRARPNRNVAGLRHDQTEVFITSDSVKERPDSVYSVGVFRGDNIEITHDANGAALVPGNTYKVYFAERDIFGNLSPLTGIGTASTATVPSFVPRFLDETAAARAVNVSGATFTLAPGDYEPMTGLTVDDGSDAAALSFDTFGNYSTASLRWVSPCDGVVACDHKSAWIGDPAKVGASTAWYLLGGWIHKRGTATLGFYGVDGIEGAGASVPFSLSLTAQVSTASGDTLTFVVRNASDSGLDVFSMAGSTASVNYSLNSYSLVNQR